MKYKAAVFDMDGTILNTIDDLRDSVNAVLAHFGYPKRSPEEIRAFVGGGSYQLIRMALPEGCSKKIVDEVHDFYRPYYAAHSEIKTAPYPGIVELLSKLKAAGLKLAVVSSKPDGPVNTLCKKYFDGVFDISIGDRPDLERKPAPDALFLALKELGVDKDEAVFTGDSEYDIAIAKNAGVFGIAVSWGYRDRDLLAGLGPGSIADSCEDIERIILGEH
jgi:phosphoglycolate phosphatase